MNVRETDEQADRQTKADMAKSKESSTRRAEIKKTRQ